MPIVILRAPASKYASAGGGTADGAVFSWTSSYSKTLSLTTKFIGQKNGPLDSGTNNTDFFGSGLDTGFANSAPGSQTPRFIAAHATIRANSLDFDAAFYKATNPSNSGAFGMGYDTGGAISEVFVSYVINWTCNASANLTALQNKQVRFTTVNDVNDDQGGNNGPFTMTSNWKDPSTGYLAVITTTGNQTTTFFDAHGNNSDYPNFNLGRTHLVEQWFKPSSAASTADGSFTIRVRRLDTGAVVTLHQITGITNYTNAQRIQWVLFQFYFGNSAPQPGAPGTADGTTTFEEPGDGRDSVENILIQHGTDAQTRSELGDASTLAACTKFLPQPWSSRSGTSCSITLNRPAALASTYQYLYEYDATGASINSSGIAVP